MTLQCNTSCLRRYKEHHSSIWLWSINEVYLINVNTTKLDLSSGPATVIARIDCMLINTNQQLAQQSFTCINNTAPFVRMVDKTTPMNQNANTLSLPLLSLSCTYSLGTAPSLQLTQPHPQINTIFVAHIFTLYLIIGYSTFSEADRCWFAPCTTSLVKM